MLCTSLRASVHSLSGVQPKADAISNRLNTSSAVSAYVFSRVAARLTPPATIRVYRTDSDTVEVVPFRDYLKHVLPNEWVPTWSPAALKAGAMAVKSYAWYWVSVGGKQVSLGADVKDNTDDQVYDPNVSYASTDAAVDATFDYALTMNGSLFATQYCAGSYQADPSGDCPWSMSYMTQWGSQYHAEHGRSWGWIVQFYYPGSTISPDTPPGGGYDGTPVPTNVPQPTTAVPTAPPSDPPVPAPSGGDFTIGQGSDVPQLFQDAYDRNGGQAALGVPTGKAHWWLTYVSEFNVIAQPLSGPDGRGNTWIVYDVLKASSQGVYRAFVLSGNIALQYANHTPPGPEWVGAPTSDHYVASPDQGGTPSQGFTKGTLREVGSSIQFAPWPEQFAGWEADYFVGHTDATGPDGAAYSLPGQPALVRDVAAPDLDWTATPNMAQRMGGGSRDWSAQFTKVVQTSQGDYAFSLGADWGVRLWVDEVLAIDSWQDRQALETLTYNASLTNGTHKIRIQYYSLTGAGKLQYNLTPQGQAPIQPPQAVTPPSTPAPPPPPPAPKAAPTGQAALRVQVQWLGRQQPASDSWAQPLTLLLSAPGDPTIIGTYAAKTDRNGVAIYQNLPAGTFDVHVKGTHSLQSARASVVLAANTTPAVDMKTQIEGDVDGDNCVTVNDFSVVQSMLGAGKNTPGFDPSADVNGDGIVTMSDISLLRSGFERCGDISADNDFQAMTADGAPTLAQALGPWENPASQEHNLTLGLSGNSNIKAGDTFTLDVFAETGSQPIDGASFVLRYDAHRFLAVDATGNPAKGVDPGLDLPSVMGNWIDGKSGAIGYSTGILQGQPPAGHIVLGQIHFRALTSAGTGPALFSFVPTPSPNMQVTNGGENLLATASDLTITVAP